MAIDVSKLNEKELQKLKSDVEKALSSFAKKKRDEARKAVEAAAKKHGFSLNDLVGGGRPAAKKPAAAAKYRNPDDASQTWSGRGRQPAWFKAAIAKGVEPSKMEI